MQPSRPHPRAPGSFSPLVHAGASSNAAASAPARPQIRKIDTSSSEDTITIAKTRGPQTPVTLASPAFPNSPSRGSPQNFSRPGRPSNDASSARNASPLTLPPTRPTHHVRKQSQTPGLFEPSLPSTSTSNLSSIAMSTSQQPASSLSASQIAAQAAMQSLSQPQTHPQQHQQPHQPTPQQHSRHRSQTVPFPGSEASEPSKRPPPKPVTGPRSPPMLSLTEASAPRDNGFGSQGYHNGLLGSHAAAATAAANVVFPRTSPVTSPGLSAESPIPPTPPVPERAAKPEKSKVKLFSRPKKIDTRGESKDRPLPSPGKIGSALASLQRGNFSTTSLADSQSFYNLGNSSSATIRPTDSPIEREGKEKDKDRKHHFLSRQKHKLTNKDEFHLPLSSAASNSRPVDPTAPSSLYSFNVPPSPGPNSNFGKSVSGLDLRHGGRALREKRKEERHGDIMRHENESSYGLGQEWSGPASLGSAATNGPSYFLDAADSSKYGLNSMSLDDAWPYLKAKLLVIFEGEDLRLPVEDFNRVVTMHIQYCIQRRSAHIIVDDLRDLLSTGFASLDHALRQTPEDQVIPALVELWVITFTIILPYMQAVFLPLDLEFAGTGSLLTPEQARDFWGGVIPASSTAASVTPASEILEVRKLVLMAYRDTLILPRYEKLKTIFSRLSLEHLPSSLASLALASPRPIVDSSASLSTSPSDPRPGTAMSLDPSVASYGSNSTTVFGNDSNPSRSRAISNVSYGSGVSDPASVGGGGASLRPFTPQYGEKSRESVLGSLRDQNVEDSKQVTDMAGRLLQCMSVLAGVGTGTGGGLNGAAPDERSQMVTELGRLLKLNWLGRGRTGRNRRGIVGGRVKRDNVVGMVREGSREGVGVVG
ncbi:HbrB-like-domain-containing protein [Xylariaceae sp. FL1272]|nr:HbrB-like-domain-containing protein [Xylariaceae sp. FL1272]